MATNSRLEAASDPILVRVCDNLVRHLERKPLPDARFTDTYRLLADRVLRSLPGPVAEDLRGAPDSGRAALAEALAGLLQSDPDVQQIVSVVLTPPGREVRGHKKRKDTIRILFLSSQPEKPRSFLGGGVARPNPLLRVDREVQEIRNALKRATHHKRFEFFDELDMRVKDLPWALLHYKPDILHFTCHGEQGAILLGGLDGMEWSLDGADLARLFVIWKGSLRCVVLNACYSAMQAEPIAREVGAAVARPDTVEDSAAILFSAEFYQGIASGRSLREAFEIGCWQLDANGGWGKAAHPVLLGEARELRFVNEKN
jgi:hypothetical protein